MAQKIIIEEVQKAEQWPKQSKYKIDFSYSEAEGAKYMAATFNSDDSEMGLYDLESPLKAILGKPIPSDSPLHGYCFLFKDQESALRWWLDPQPIEPPKPLTFGELNVGEWFVCSGEIQVKIPPMARISDSMELNSMTTYGYGGWLLDDTIVTRCTVTKE